MPPFRSILCPVDFSAHAAHALRHAAALAAIASAKLTVAWATDPLLAQAAAVYGFDPKGEGASADLRDFVAGALPLEAPWLPQPELVITVGTPDQEILAVARNTGADLIVMGTHGLSGYQKLFFGSTTEQVLRQTTIPVLAVPISDSALLLGGEGPRLAIKTIVIGVDLGETSTRLAGFGVSLAAALSARPILVHVVPRDSAPARWQPAVDAHQQSASDLARQELSRLAAAAGDGAVETAVALGHPAQQIATLAEARQAGMIVMGLMGRTGMLSARPGSIAYRLVSLTPTPVLVVPPAALEAYA